MEQSSEKNIKSAVEVTGLTVGYDDFVILDNISFNIKKGEIFVILGGSGCGKSTLLKHLIGLYQPIDGDIKINGESIVNANLPEKELMMRHFGVLYQSAALFSSLTLAENIALPLREFTDLSEDMISAVASVKLSMVGLSGFEDFNPSEISGGMKKRAGLARAMALNPEILFFDEPSAGLDPISSAELDKLILDIRASEKTTMVIVTHELDSIFTIADRVIVLDKETKNIIDEGDPRYLKDHSEHPWVRKFLNRDNLKQI
jgi:phospholipid/cholesterol/gamma-HCH transport system ATP-binding protein